MTQGGKRGTGTAVSYRDSPDPARVEKISRTQDDLAANDVCTLAADILARVDGCEHTHFVVSGTFGLFDHHDGIRAIRHGRAGGDFHAGAFADARLHRFERDQT